MISQPVWRKQIDKFILLEYPGESNKLPCTICHTENTTPWGKKDDQGNYTMSFESWGMDREKITLDDCLEFCSGTTRYPNIPIASFMEGIDLTADMNEEDEDEHEAA